MESVVKEGQKASRLMEDSTSASLAVPSARKSRRAGRNGKWFSRIRVTENLLERLRQECAEDEDCGHHERVRESLAPLAEVHCLGRPVQAVDKATTRSTCDSRKAPHSDALDKSSLAACLHARSPSEDEGISEVASLPSLDTGSDGGSSGHTSKPHHQHHHHPHPPFGTCLHGDFDDCPSSEPSINNHAATMATEEMMSPCNLDDDVILDLPLEDEEDDENDTSSSSSLASSDSGAGGSPDFISQEGAVWAVTNCFSWLDDETFALEPQDTNSADDDQMQDENKKEENVVMTNCDSLTALRPTNINIAVDEDVYISSSSLWSLRALEWSESNKQMSNAWAPQQSSERLPRDVEKVTENDTSEKSGENAETWSGSLGVTCMTDGAKEIKEEKGGRGKEPSEHENIVANDLGKRPPSTPRVWDVAWNLKEEEETEEEEENGVKCGTQNVAINDTKEETCGEEGGVLWESEDANSRGSWSESDWSETDTCILREPFVRDSDGVSVDSVPGEELGAGELSTSPPSPPLVLEAPKDFNSPPLRVTLHREEEPWTSHHQHHHHHHHHSSLSCLGCLVEGDKAEIERGETSKREKEERSSRSPTHPHSWLGKDRWPLNDNRRWYKLGGERSLGDPERESGRCMRRGEACTQETPPGNRDRSISNFGGDEDDEMEEEEEGEEEKKAREFSRWRDLCRRLEDLSRDHPSYLECHDHTSTTTVPRQPKHPPSPPPRRRRRRRRRRQSWATVGESCQLLAYESAPGDPWLAGKEGTKQPEALRDTPELERYGCRSEPSPECLCRVGEQSEEQRGGTSSDESEAECAGDLSDTGDRVWHTNDSLDCYSLGYSERHSKRNQQYNEAPWIVAGETMARHLDASHVNDPRLSSRWKRKGRRWNDKRGRLSSHNLDITRDTEYTWSPSPPCLVMPRSIEERDYRQAPLHAPMSLPTPCLCHHSAPPSLSSTPTSYMYYAPDQPVLYPPPCLPSIHEEPQKYLHSVMLTAAEKEKKYTERNYCDCGAGEGGDAGDAGDRWPESAGLWQLGACAAYGHYNVCKKNYAHGEAEGTLSRESRGGRIPAGDAETRWEFSSPRDSSWFEGNLHFHDRTSVCTVADGALPSGAYRGAAARTPNSQAERDLCPSEEEVSTGFSQIYATLKTRREGEASGTRISRGKYRRFQTQRCPGRGVPVEAKELSTTFSRVQRDYVVEPTNLDVCTDKANEHRGTSISGENITDSGAAASSLASLQRRMPVPASCFTHALCSRVPLYKRIQDALCRGVGLGTLPSEANEATSNQQLAEPIIAQPRSLLRDNPKGSGVSEKPQRSYSPSYFSFPEEADVKRTESNIITSRLPEGHRRFSFDGGGDEGPRICTLKLAAREPPDGTATPPAPVGSFLHRFSSVLPSSTRIHHSVADPHKELVASEESYRHHYLSDAQEAEQRVAGFGLQDAVPAGLPPRPATATTQLSASLSEEEGCSSSLLPPSPPPSPPPPQHANPLHRQPLECASSTASRHSPHSPPTACNGPQQLLCASGRSSPCISRDSLELFCDDGSDFGSVSLPSTPDASLSPHDLPGDLELHELSSHDTDENFPPPPVFQEGELEWLSSHNSYNEECSISSPLPTSSHCSVQTSGSPQTTVFSVCKSPQCTSPCGEPHRHTPPSCLEILPPNQISGPPSSHKSIIPESPSQQSSILLAVDPPVSQPPDTFSLVDIMKLGSYDGYVTLPVTFKSAQIGEDEARMESIAAPDCEESSSEKCVIKKEAEGETQGDVIISTQVRVSLRKYCRRRRNGSKKLIIRFTLCLGKYWDELI
ncbi:hypothetical protein E2C01_022335 [Portunus trituberculatus]|uniref:Uncharacterized protein n=1 Tax=Portunus trituberculatus TaxID=210409 RepID=A0A5B7E707_PORTR|nr:hypothetical protein [Portunus trituberculatus]